MTENVVECALTERKTESVSFATRRFARSRRAKGADRPRRLRIRPRFPPSLIQPPWAVQQRNRLLVAGFDDNLPSRGESSGSRISRRPDDQAKRRRPEPRAARTTESAPSNSRLSSFSATNEGFRRPATGRIRSLREKASHSVNGPPMQPNGKRTNSKVCARRCALVHIGARQRRFDSGSYKSR